MKIRTIVLLVICGMLLPSCREKQEPVATLKPWVRKTGKMLMMHYMPWYETPGIRGRWGTHWTGHQNEHKPDQLDAKGLPDIWSHYHPLIGLYDSTDSNVLECQLLQMKIAGVDGVIVDWYGIGPSADYPSIHQATIAIFGATGRRDMKFAVCFEDRSIAYMEQLKVLKPEQVRSHLTETMQWMQQNWFSQPQYIRIGGRPLLLNFGPMHVSDAATWSAALGTVPDRPAFYGLHHLWKNVGADGGFMWVNQDVWKGNPDQATIRKRLQKEYDHASVDPAKLIVSAYPGFRDVYAQSHPVLEHRGGRTMRESMQVCLGGVSDIVQLVTWNDYGEGTMIEPTHEFGYTFLEVIQSERRQEIGSDFPFEREDLLLPARLLALRRKPNSSNEACDRIATLIAAGDCVTARAELEQMEAN